MTDKYNELLSKINSLMNELEEAKVETPFLDQFEEQSRLKELEQLKDKGFTEDKINQYGKPTGYKRLYSDLCEYYELECDINYSPKRRIFFAYDGKKYNELLEDHVRKYAQDHFKNPLCEKQNERNEFLGLVKSRTQADHFDYMLRDTGMINFNNGIYNIVKGELVEHDRKYRMSNLIQCDFVDDDKAPVWDELLSLITCNKPHQQIAIEEFIGYCLSGCEYKKFNKALVLDGGGSNGKSTLIRVISGLLGSENTSAIGLVNFAKERFAGINLVNKLVNFCNEEPPEAFSDTGPFKKLTGGDPVMVEQKNFPAFSFNNVAKFIVSYNKMPFFPDDSDGMRRRLIVIPCLQNFEKFPDRKLHDPEIRILKNERSQVIYRCIKAYTFALKRGAFTTVLEGIHRVDEMIKDSNPVISFIEENISITGESFLHIENDKLWESYKNFTDGGGKMSKLGFLKKFREHVFLHNAECKTGKSAIGNRGIFGIEFK